MKKSQCPASFVSCVSMVLRHSWVKFLGFRGKSVTLLWQVVLTNAKHYNCTTNTTTAQHTLHDHNKGLVGDSLGCSDHEMTEFRTERGRSRAADRIATLDFRRASWASSGTYLEESQWD